MKEIEFGNSRIFVLGTIHGLLSEKEKIIDAFQSIKPDAVGIDIPSCDLSVLEDIAKKGHEKQEVDDPFLEKLRDYGDVEVPPPDILTSYRIAKEFGIPVHPIDLDDDAYADAFCKHISAWSLIWQSSRTRRLKKRKFKARTAEEFVLEWNEVCNKTKGYGLLQEERQKHMADELCRLTEKHKKILAVVDLAMENGIAEKLV